MHIRVVLLRCFAPRSLDGGKVRTWGYTQDIASQRVGHRSGRVVLGGLGFHPYDLQ
jgi:hypothetical protein